MLPIANIAGRGNEELKSKFYRVFGVTRQGGDKQEMTSCVMNVLGILFLKQAMYYHEGRQRYS